MRRQLQQSAFAFLTQEEHSAYASMLVASLPFFPLPVLLLQGYEELKKGGDELVSSFDLLKEQAIVSHQLAKPARGLAGGPVRTKWCRSTSFPDRGRRPSRATLGLRPQRADARL